MAGAAQPIRTANSTAREELALAIEILRDVASLPSNQITIVDRVVDRGNTRTRWCVSRP